MAGTSTASTPSASISIGLPEPTFDKQKHIRYWLRMFKTVLPTHYQSTDSNRMFLAFTILSSLDILGVLHQSPLKFPGAPAPPITDSERAAAVDWVYLLQHPSGGFRAFPGTDFGAAEQSGEQGNGHLDPPNAAGTCFALLSLVVLRDDLSRVDRGACLRWLRRLQAADDGSFAEILGPDGKPCGKRDVRHGYFAAATRYVLDVIGEVRREDDIDTSMLVESVLACQSYDGGIAGEPGTESHGGYAYCAVGCLALLGKLSKDMPNTVTRTYEFIQQLIPNLVYRQVSWEEGESDDEDSSEGETGETNKKEAAESNDQEQGSYPPPLSRWIGFDGRCNKPADTCYTFWVGGTLALLGLSDELIDPLAHRRFLLERTEHRIGGFGKTPGDPPDALHSFMGLLALSYMHEPSLQPIDASMAMTQAARDHLESLRKREGHQE